jgi:DUF971 family protein
MGLLDDLKPARPKPRPLSWAVEPAEIAIAWDDGRMRRYPFRLLRTRCPCAGCVDEFSGKRTLDPASVAADIKPVDVHEMGRYALGIHWSDGHATGIYSWDFFNGLEPELSASRPAPPSSA